MITPIGNGAPAQQPADNQSKIERLLTTMENVRKELRELRKEWEKAADPKVRRELSYRMQALEEMLENLRQQFIMLTQMENARKNSRKEIAAEALQHEPARKPSTSADAATGADAENDNGSADIYSPPGLH